MRADGPGGDRHAFDDAIGEGLQEHSVHERAGVTFVAVAEDVFLIARGGPNGGPFYARGKTGPAASSQAAHLDLFDQLVGRSFFEAVLQRIEAAVSQVFVQVGRIDLPAILGGQMLLTAEERTNRPVADVDRMARDRVTPFVGHQSIEPPRDGVPDPLNEARRLEMFQDDRGGVLGRDLGEEFRGPLFRDDLDQGRLMAHAHASDPFYRSGSPGRVERLGHGLMDLAATLGNAAGAEPDANFADRIGRLGGLGFSRGRAVGRLFQEIVQHAADHRGSQPAVGHLVDLNDRRQGAASQAGDFFDGKQPLGVGVAAVADSQLPLQRILDQSGPLHMAGRSVTDANDMAPDRLMAKLGVEGRDAADLGRANVA